MEYLQVGVEQRLQPPCEIALFVAESISSSVALT